MVYLEYQLQMTIGWNMENRVRVADEVWIAVATLHRRHPDRADFAISEIMAQAEAANVTGIKPLRPGVKVHAYLHCVANKPPNPGRYRMLFETVGGRRRLVRPGDLCHPLRAAGKGTPKRHEIPVGYRDLIDWYVREYAVESPDDAEDPVLSLRGLGEEIWADENADAYVRRQRSGWR